jgi:hypothetical protein
MHQMRISTTDAQVEKVENPEKMWKLKEPPDENQQSAMKVSQIRRRIDLCLTEIILRFDINLQNLLFFLIVQFIILKEVPKYLATRICFFIYMNENSKI